MTDRSEHATTGEWQPRRSPVVVGADGSKANAAAVEWAAHEAAQTGVDLVLLGALELQEHRPPWYSTTEHEQRVRAMLEDLAGQVAPVLPRDRVVTETVDGSPVEALLEHAGDARLLVLGKRGLGAVSRLLVGSTSLAVAGRAPVPVVVVPDSWMPNGHVRRPIVVGVDPYRAHQPVLRLAFRRAERLDVPLVAVHGWEVPAGLLMDGPEVAESVAQWKAEARAAFEKLVGEWEGRFPHVRLSTVRSDLHPATAVLEAAERAQLVVLGRHATSRFHGFGFGSVTRAVLHYSECPVLVVPDEDA
ncbi:MAG: universal stress protein [Nocardioidaceae bacterium]